MTQEKTQQNGVAKKPSYVAPTISSFAVETLQAQLGPARAFSPTSSENADLFGDEY